MNYCWRHKVQLCLAQGYDRRQRQIGEVDRQRLNTQDDRRQWVEDDQRRLEEDGRQPEDDQLLMDDR